MTSIFELSRSGRGAYAQFPKLTESATLADIPATLLREKDPGLPEVSELQVVRHFTNLSTKNFSIDNQFYPLGSCTMKYNPRGAQPNSASSTRGTVQNTGIYHGKHAGYLGTDYLSSTRVGGR